MYVARGWGGATPLIISPSFSLFNESSNFTLFGFPVFWSWTHIHVCIMPIFLNIEDSVGVFEKKNLKLENKSGGLCLKTSLTPPLYIDVPVPSQLSYRLCMYVLRVSIFVYVSNVFWNCPDNMVCFGFILYIHDR